MPNHEESMTGMQRKYWDGLSDKYQRSMHIALDDFHYGPQIPGESTLKLLPKLTRGMKALELGCGAAQNSIWLAKKGIECDAVDISAEQLAHARTLAKRENVKISFARAALEALPPRFKGPYDIIHSSHAFEFVDEPSLIITKLAKLLSNNGTLVISTVHPLYNGDWVESFDEDGNQDGMGLFLKNYFVPPDDIRKKRGKIEVISRAYPVSVWFNWMKNAGLTLVSLEEPAGLAPDGNPPYTNKDWADTEGELQSIPGTLILVARRSRIH